MFVHYKTDFFLTLLLKWFHPKSIIQHNIVYLLNTINKFVNKSCSNAVIKYFYWPHWSLSSAFTNTYSHLWKTTYGTTCNKYFTRRVALRDSLTVYKWELMSCILRGGLGDYILCFIVTFISHMTSTCYYGTPIVYN